MRTRPLRDLHQRLCRMLKGHYAYFGISGNYERLASLPYHVARIWSKWLSRSSNKRSLPWVAFTDITTIALWEEDNQTVGGLGEKLFLESNTLTRMLKKLEVMGYLERQRDPEDERQVRVRLTKIG